MKKKRKQGFIIAGFILLFIFLFLIWKAFFPGSVFFRSEYSNITGMKLAREAKIVHYWTSFPPRLRQYNYCFIVEMPTKDRRRLEAKLDSFPRVESNVIPSLKCQENCNQRIDSLQVEQTLYLKEDHYDAAVILYDNENYVQLVFSSHD